MLLRDAERGWMLELGASQVLSGGDGRVTSEVVAGLASSKWDA